MVTATRRFEFSAAHRYWRTEWTQEENERAFGAYAGPHGHGHNYTLDVTVAGPVDERTGMIMNMAELKAIVGAVLEEFDHRHLNEDTPYFVALVPTTENVVRVLWALIAPRLPAGVRLDHLRLYELADLWADYDGSDEATFARSYGFSAAHRLHAPGLSDEENRALYGKCNNPAGHGHNYTVEVSVAGPVDPERGTVIDLEAMDAAVRSVLDRMHLRHLDRELPAFAGRPSTGESIVAVLWDELAPRLAGRLRHLRLWETRKNAFVYRDSPA